MGGVRPAFHLQRPRAQRSRLKGLAVLLLLFVLGGLAGVPPLLQCCSTPDYSGLGSESRSPLDLLFSLDMAPRLGRSPPPPGPCRSPFSA